MIFVDREFTFSLYTKVSVIGQLRKNRRIYIKVRQYFV